ncbi:MAG: hypothetical protein ABI837_13610, partial [Acidobacteriota bacterium]
AERRKDTTGNFHWYRLTAKGAALDIRGWLRAGQEQGETHVIVCCDTFDNSDYPVYIKPGTDPSTYRPSEMQMIMECYALHLDWNAQLAEYRSRHFEMPPAKIVVSQKPVVAKLPASTFKASAPEIDLDQMEKDALAKIPEKAADYPVWSGPCGDSFCFASCDMAHCRYQNRLGKTPAEHNAKIDAMVAADPVLILVAQLRKERAEAMKIVKRWTREYIRVRCDRTKEDPFDGRKLSLEGYRSEGVTISEDVMSGRKKPSRYYYWDFSRLVAAPVSR